MFLAKSVDIMFLLKVNDDNGYTVTECILCERQNKKDNVKLYTMDTDSSRPLNDLLFSCELPYGTRMAYKNGTPKKATRAHDKVTICDRHVATTCMTTK